MSNHPKNWPVCNLVFIYVIASIVLMLYLHFSKYIYFSCLNKSKMSCVTIQKFHNNRSVYNTVFFPSLRKKYYTSVKQKSFQMSQIKKGIYLQSKCHLMFAFTWKTLDKIDHTYRICFAFIWIAYI